MRTRLPRLYDADLSLIGPLDALRQRISLEISPPSSANIRVKGADAIPMRSFVEIYTAKGSAGIFRATSSARVFGGGDDVVLEHGICVLDDAVYDGDGTLEGSLSEVAAKILQKQVTKAKGKALWKLGTVAAPQSKKIKVDYSGTKLLGLLVKAIDTAGEYMLRFDQSVFPWVVSIEEKKKEPKCEGRLGRNIRTIRMNTDTSRLCTRIYCDLLDGGHIDADTVGTWGIVSENVMLADNTPKDEAKAYCEKLLEQKKNPMISVEMDAIEWFAMTGEALDRFEIGDVCRAALERYGVTIDERIVSMRYEDAIDKPCTVSVTMANRPRDLSGELSKNRRDSNNSNNQSIRHGNGLRQTNEALMNLSVSHEEWIQTTQGLAQRVNTVEIDLDAVEAEILLKANSSTVAELASRVSNAEIEIDGLNAEILLKASVESVTTLMNRVSQAEIDIDGANAQILLKASQTVVDELGERVSSAEISIDGLNSEIELKADRIDLRGYVTASEFSALESDIAQLLAGTVQASHLYTQNLTATNTVRLSGYTCVWKKMDVVTGVSISKDYASVPGANGVTYTVISGVSLSKSTEEIKYFGRD